MVHEQQENLAWCIVGEIAVFLDIDQDRYFRLSDARNASFLAGAGTVRKDAPHQPCAFPLPAAWCPPRARSAAIDLGPFRLGDVARALWMQRRVERRLGTHSFAAILRDVRSVTTGHASGAQALPVQASRDIRAFEHAKLLRSTKDRCLPRSIALALHLSRRGCRPFVVLGVKFAPFAAHCWTQLGDEIVNDEVEEVLRYTPILVL